MNKKLALTPPMGWNSWDCYGASVTEEEVRGNAEYMAKYLKEYGWEYVVIDAQWFEPTADSSIYKIDAVFDMDEYGRLMPATNRFPSALGKNGFKPLADYIHSLGLKFGIHMMRGIPRQAVNKNTPILGSQKRARDIADTNNICSWNSDMYGVDPTKEGAAEYYNSVFKLLAEWEIDFVKVDDIVNPYSKGEIELVYYAIEKCGREIVLSLSPGASPIEEAEHLKEYAQLWRISSDFWDKWEHLYDAFEKCHLWENNIGEGHWPDADMLPLGRIGIRSFEHLVGDRNSRYTRDEQTTLMTLWCIARSPLFLGGELRDNDSWDLSLLTNEEVLKLHRQSYLNRQLYRRGDEIVWTATDNNNIYVAVFNTSNKAPSTQITINLGDLDVKGKVAIRDVWKKTELGIFEDQVKLDVKSHGARLIKIEIKSMMGV